MTCHLNGPQFPEGTICNIAYVTGNEESTVVASRIPR